LLLFAALLALGATLGWNLYVEHNTIDGNERERLKAQTRIIDENLGWQLRATSHVLDSIRAELPDMQTQKDAGAAINRRLKSMTEAMPGVRTLLILDANGTATASNREQLLGQNFREREYFQAMRQVRDPAMLHVSPPYKTVLGAWGMNLVKSIFNERGEFAGVISATLDNDYFSTLLNSVRYSPAMRTYLAHADGSLVLIVPALPDIQGANLAQSGSFFSRHRDSGQKTSVMTGNAYINGEARMIAQTTVRPDRFPMDNSLVVGVANGQSAIFADWRRDARMESLLFTLIILLGAIGMYVFQQRQRAYDSLVEDQRQARKRNYDALRESENKMRFVFENARVGIFITTRDGQFDYVNPAMPLIFGYDSCEELIATVSRSSIGETLYVDAAVGQAVMKEFRRNPDRWQIIEERFRRKDGRIIDAMVTVGQRHESAIGEFRMYGIVTDMTERKRMELSLRESEARNMALINAIPDLIFSNRRDGEYLSVHAPDPGLLFLPQEAFLHRKIREILPEPIADQFMRAIAAALDSGVMQDIRYTLTVKGTEKYFEARIVPSGEDTTIALVRDITEPERERRRRELQRTAHLSDRLRMTEFELRESEQRLTLAADAAGLGIWVRDLVRDDIWASDKWRELFGFTPSQQIDIASVLQHVHVEDRPNFFEKLALAATSSGWYETEHRVVPTKSLAQANQPVRWIASFGRVELDAGGRPILTRGVSLDITARKQAEIEIQQRRAEVAQLSRNATLGELSGAMAHELNQPLATILINTQVAQRMLAQDSVDLTALAEILQDILDEDKRAGDIIWRLRQLFDRIATPRASIDMNQFMKELTHILRIDLMNHGVTLQTDLTPDCPVASADKVQLQQVAINLIMNACEAMRTLPAPERLIVLRTAVAENTMIQVSVIDCGCGLPAGNIEQLFKAFHSTKEHGMGLGLSICRNIVSAGGGRLWAENNADRGASFHFTVPVQTSGEA
jgi:PAS domain S-box-containing protein